MNSFNVTLLGFGNINGFPRQISVLNSHVILEDYDKISRFDFKDAYINFINKEMSLQYNEKINVKNSNDDILLGSIINISTNDISVNDSLFSGFNKRARLTFGFDMSGEAVIKYNNELAPSEWYSVVNNTPLTLDVLGFDLCGNILGCSENKYCINNRCEDAS
jgi:hypothetical protein